MHNTWALISKLKLARAGLLHDLLTRGLDEEGRLRDPEAHPEQFKETVVGRVPVEWEITQLQAICDRITDGTHGSVRTTASGVFFLFVSCVRARRIYWEQAGHIDERVYQSISRGREPKPGLILYTAVGATYGNAAVVDRDVPFSFQRHIAYILPNKDVILPEFLSEWLNSPRCRAHADIVAVGNAQKTVTLGSLGRFPVPLPSLGEQRRCLAAVKAYDSRVRAEEAYRDKLKLQKQGLMHDLLTERVRVPGADASLA